MFEQRVVAENFFLKDIHALRETAQKYLGDAPTANGPEASVELLQTVLSAEIICVLRYTMISVSPDGLKNTWIGAEFQEQANDERKHMKMAAERIQQLGGVPNFNPESMASRITASQDSHGNFARYLHENLAAEQDVMEHYRDLIRHFSPTDSETCSMLEDIIRDEEDHTNDMQDLLSSYAC
jgi:bacterioferritin